MALVALKCPNCGGALDLDDSREFGFCQYCGTKIMIQEEKKKQLVEVDDSKKIVGWLDSAKLFLERGMKEECYRYACMATDADPNNGIAWYYRAESAPNGDDQLVAVMRATDLLSESDPFYAELEGLKKGAMDRVTVTIVNSIGGSYPLTVYYDKQIVPFTSGNVATLSSVKGQHSIRAKTTVLSKTVSANIMADSTINVTLGLLGMSISLSSNATPEMRQAKFNPTGQVKFMIDPSLKGNVTLENRVSGFSIEAKPGQTVEIPVDCGRGNIYAVYQGATTWFNLSFRGNPTYTVKPPAWGSKLCRIK